MALIHSPNLVGEPITLRRRPAPRPAAPTAIAAVRATEAPSPAAVSYDEYKQRIAAELDAERRAARESGLAQGLEAGLAKAAAEHAGQIEGFTNLLRAARTRVDEGFEHLAEQSAEVAFEAVCKILGQSLATREGVIAVVRELVRRVRDRSRLVMRVSPADFDLLSESRDQLLAGLEAGQVDIVSDERVQLGGCLLETPAGNLDARLEVQLANLRQALTAARAGSSEAA